MRSLRMLELETTSKRLRIHLYTSVNHFMVLSSTFLLASIWFPWAETSFHFSQYGFSKSVLCFSTGICSRSLRILILCFLLSNCTSFAHISILPYNLPLKAILFFQYLCQHKLRHNIFVLGLVNWPFCHWGLLFWIPSPILYSTSHWLSSSTSQAFLTWFCSLPFFSCLNPHFVKTTCAQVIYFNYTWHEFIDPGYSTIFKIEEKPRENIHEL